VAPGFKRLLVIILVIIAFLSIPAFANDYPHLGQLCLAVDAFVIAAWILFAGHTHWLFWILLLVALVIGVIAYANGVPREWRRWIGVPELGMEQQQEIPPTTPVLMC
jgi:type II secretory pathway component PulF